MPPLLGPLACFNLSCLAILFLVLWRTANDLPPEAGVAFSDRAERFFGTLVDVFGLDLETQWEDVGKPHWQPDDDGDEARPSLTTAFSGEASLFVERTEAYHASRPALFGPHLHKSLPGTLIPYSVIAATQDNYACGDIPENPSVDPQQHEQHPKDWIALIERGGSCSFATKIRAAQKMGATAAIVGNNQPGSSLLVSMWSPGETKDIVIPSVFISSKSYIELLRVWDDAQEELEDGGLKVIMSKEDILSWDVSDVLLTLLFLPSMLTLATLLSHHVSLYRSQRLERAPRAVVESLPWVQWGIDDQSTGGQTQHQQRGSTSRHEERRDLEEAPPPPRVQQARWTNAWLWSHRVKQWLQYKANVKSDAAVNASIHPPRPFSELAQSKLRGQEDCAICLSAFEVGEAVRWLPCHHVLHAQCVDPWLLKTSRCCPLCRYPVEQEMLPNSNRSEATSSAISVPSQASEPVPVPTSDTERTPLLSRSLPNL